MNNVTRSLWLYATLSCLAFSVEAQISDTVVLCFPGSTYSNAPAGIFYDSGGPQNNYNDGEFCTLHINPGCATSIICTVESFATEGCCDYLTFYDGSDESAPILASLSSIHSNELITSTSGNLFIRWYSDGSSTSDGFVVRWNSVTVSGNAPVATASASKTNPAFLEKVQFTGQATNFPVSWLWDFGDQTTAGVPNPVHAWSEAGDYTVRLIVTSCSGMKDTAEQTITVQQPPVLNFDPQLFDVKVPCGDSAQAVLHLGNTGTGDLVFENDVRTSIAPHLLIYNLYTNTTTVQGVVSALQATGLQPLIEYSEAATAAQLEADLKNTDILIFPEAYIDPGFLMTLTPALQNFVGKGGSVIYLGTPGHQNTIAGTDLLHSFNLYPNYYQYSIIPISTNHPLTKNLPNAYYAPVYTIGLPFYDPDYVSLSTVNANSIIGYREIGKAKVIYLGFNYQEPDGVLLHLMANALRWCGSRTRIVPEPKQGIVAPGGNTTVVFTFSADHLVAGDYPVEIFLTSNDPDRLEVALPCVMHVEGNAAAVPVPASLNFDSVMQFRQRELNFTLENPGCDTLRVTAAIATLPEFSASPGAFTIPPFHSDTFTARFAPADTGQYNGLLQFQSNIGPIDIPVQGYAFGAPVAGVAPAGIELNLACKDSASVPVSFANTGLGALFLEQSAASADTGASFRILFLDFTAYNFGTLNNTSMWASATFPHAQVDHFTASDPIETLPDRLAEHQLVILPGLVTLGNLSGAQFGEHLRNYMEHGGSVVLTGNFFLDFMNSMQLTQISSMFNLYNAPLHVEQPGHPLLEGLDLSGPSYDDLYAMIVDDPEFIPVATYSGAYLGIGYKNFGSGRFVYLAYECENGYPVQEKAFVNAIRWANTPQWVTSVPPSLQLAPGNSFDGALHFNTDGLNAGAYTYHFTWQTNDPHLPFLHVPVTVHVSGDPELFLPEPSLSFGVMQQFAQKKLNLKIRNTGCDTLHITSIEPDNAAFSVSLNYPVLLAPKHSAFIEVAFMPVLSGAQTGNLLLQTDGGTAVVGLSGLAVPSPVSSTDPALLSLNLGCDSAVLQSLLLINSGAGTLNYQFGGVSQPKNILTILYGASYWKWQPLRNMLISTIDNLTIREFNQTAPEALADSLLLTDILILPVFDLSGGPEYLSFAPVISDFLARGGQVLVMGGYYSGPVQQMGVLPVYTTNSYADAQVRVLIPGHPAFQGLSDQFAYHDAGQFAIFPAGSMVKVATVDNLLYLGYRQAGKGNVVYWGAGLEGTSAPENPVIAANLINWLSNPLPPGATLLSGGGVVGPGSSKTVDFQFDGTKIPGGVYTGYLHIRTNDPVHNTLLVPIELNVSKKPCIDFTYSAPPCSGAATFQDKTVNALSSWYWTFGDGFESFVQNPTHTYTNDGNYLVTLVGCNSSGCDTFSQQITIAPFAGPKNIACKPKTLSYCCGAGIFRVKLGTLDYSSGNASEGYGNFSCKAGTELMAGSTYPVWIVTGDQYQEITQVWIDLDNDGALESQEYVFGDQNYINHQGYITIPANTVRDVPLRMRVSSDAYFFSNPLPCSDLNYGQAEDYYVIARDIVGTNAPTERLELRIYPNPSAGETWLEYSLPHPEPLVVRITDEIGRQVVHQQLESGAAGRNRWRLPDLPAGVYFLTARSGLHAGFHKLIRVEQP